MGSGSATDPGKPSDQLPEEAPTEVAYDDVPEAEEGAARNPPVGLLVRPTSATTGPVKAAIATDLRRTGEAETAALRKRGSLPTG